ncbi:MAG: hypothetical protein JO307_21035 [Bryobacterales bacterium]|nr:hypothetical protein [Bryobacterales bacterium]
MTKADFLMRILAARDDADIYVLTADGDWILVEDLEVATTQAIVLHPQRPLIEAAP